MPKSICDSFRDNEYACATFATPFGIPFFGWADNEYRKLSMEELRPQYEAWERHQAALRAQALAFEGDSSEEEYIEEVLFVEEVKNDNQNPNYLTVEDYVPEISYDAKPPTIREVDTSSLGWEGPSKFIVIVQDVEADSAYIQDKLDIGEAFVTLEEVSERIVPEVNVDDTTYMPSLTPSTSFIGADLLKRIFSSSNALGAVHDVIAVEDLEEEREVEEWLFVGIEDDKIDEEVVACKSERKQRRPRIDRRVTRARRSLATIGNNVR